MTGRVARPRRGGYLLPSLFTIGNMLLGFYAIVCGFHGLIPRAALSIFSAGVLDGLDGRIARLTGTESDFGREYDSLADLLTFGVAPSLVCYFWGFQDFGRVGWLVPLFFTVCTATRLARFNVQSRTVDSRYFAGLPSPAAAAVICSALFFLSDSRQWSGLPLLMMAALLCVGTLMISTLRYRSFKQLDLRRRWSYRVVLPVTAILCVIAYEPAAAILALATVYTASGPLAWTWNKLVRRSPRPADKSTPGPTV